MEDARVRLAEKARPRKQIVAILRLASSVRLPLSRCPEAGQSIAAIDLLSFSNALGGLRGNRTHVQTAT